MANTSSPTVWRRWLALEMKRLRTAAGLSMEQVAEAFGSTRQKVSYIESAARPVRPDDLEQVLLPLYDVPEDRWPAYIQAARDARARGWWQRYGQQVVPEWFSLYVGLEQGATQLWAYELALIPGLLQTSAYASAVLSHDVTRRTENQVARLVDVRIERQAALTRESDPLDLWVVFYEAALTGEVGGPAVMREQLDHVVELAERPNVTVQVLPFARGTHVAVSGPFRLLGFGWPNDPGVVYIEYRGGAVYLEGPDEVDEHRLAFQHLCANALPPDESIDLIRDVARKKRAQ